MRADTPPHGDDHLAGRVAYGALVMAGARVGLRLINLIGLAILARLLTPQDYGVMALALAVLAITEVMSHHQFNAALIRLPEIADDQFDTAFTLGVLRGALVAGFILLAAGPLAAATAAPVLRDVLLAVAFAPLIDGFRNPRFVLYERRLDFSREFAVLLVSKLGAVALSVALALWRADVWALVAGALAERAIWLGLTYALAPARRPRPTLRRWRAFLGFGGWLAAANIVQQINYRSDAVIIGPALGPAAVGQYAMGDQIATIATNEIATAFTRAIYPGLAAIGQDRPRLRAAYRRAQTTTLAVVLPIGLGTALTAREIVLLAAGPQWTMAIPVVEVVAPLMALGMLGAGVSAVVMIDDRTRLLFERNLLNLALRLPLLVLGLWLHGFMGMLYARIVSNLAMTAATLDIAARLLGGRMFDPIVASWRSFLASGALASAVLAAAPVAPDPAAGAPAAAVALGIKAAAGGAAYLVAHMALWLAAGRPEGVETTFIRLAGKVFASVRRRRGRD